MTSGSKNQYMNYRTFCTILVLAPLLVSVCFADNHKKLPLISLLDDDGRDYWLPNQVNIAAQSDAFVVTVNATVQPETRKVLANQNKIDIALIYPGTDLSDFWERSLIALKGRLDDLGIPYAITEFKSKQIEHSLQTEYVQQVVKQKEDFDFVIFGPSELSIQKKNIVTLVQQKNFETFIWSFHTPLKELPKQPLMWFDYSGLVGAEVLCEYMIERLGRNVDFAMNRGIPGITDRQRSGAFKQCVEQRGNWQVTYEHYGQYQATGGADGAALITEHYPEVRYLHNANTAMTIGALSVFKAVPAYKRPLISGWGGTAKELDYIKRKLINATPMRMGDDLAVATAEAIRYVLRGNKQDLPLVFLGRILVANDQMPVEELDALEEKAFRYSNKRQ